MYPYKRRCDRCSSVGEQRSVDSFYCANCDERARARRQDESQLPPGGSLAHGRIFTGRTRRGEKR